MPLYLIQIQLKSNNELETKSENILPATWIFHVDQDADVLVQLDHGDGAAVAEARMNPIFDNKDGPKFSIKN